MDIGESGVGFALEVAHEFRQALGEEYGCAAPGLALLLFVVEAGGDRVVRVMHFGQPVGDGELLAMQAQARGVVPGREA